MKSPLSATSHRVNLAHALAIALLTATAACGGSTRSAGDAGARPDAGVHEGDADNRDGGTDDGGTDDGGETVASCSDCSAGQLCVITVSGGGACFPATDAGTCPNGGTAPPGTCCSNETTTYECTSPPSGCNGHVTCGCASSLCDGCPCDMTQGSSALNCECLAP